MDMNENVIRKVAIIGGSGKAGRFLVKQTLEAGYQMRVLMRDPAKFKLSDERIEVLKGDARDFPSIKSLLQGCDAVLSALREPKGETPIRSIAAGHVLTAMKELGMRRYILICGAAVDAPGDRKDFYTKLLTMLMLWLLPAIAADEQKVLTLLMKSEVEWTLVRLPLIVEEPMARGVKVNLERLPGKKINGVDLAIFLITQIADKQYVRKAPFIAN
jgi:putative NADH-flavin reductase